MSTETRYSVGTITTGEAALQIYPKQLPASPRPGVLYIHGAGSDATYCISPVGNQNALTKLVAEAGYVGLSADLGGPATWGNSIMKVRTDSAYTHLQTMPGVAPGEVALISASMGGLGAINWAAANTNKVACIIAVIPVINLTDIFVSNRSGCAPSINGAYANRYTEAEFGAAFNPQTIANGTVLDDIPILIFYGLTDTLCLPAEVTAFAAKLNNVTLVPLPSGHDFTSYNLVDHPLAVAFLEEHAA